MTRAHFHEFEINFFESVLNRDTEYTDVIGQAGRNTVVVDIDAFAVQNCFEANYGLDAGVTVLLNAGASSMNVNVVAGEQSLFTRDISIGGNAYTEAVQREFNLTFELAEQVKRGHAIDGVPIDDVRPVLRTVTEGVLLEISKTFDFFKATTGLDRIDRILLCGGTSRVDGFAAALEERFGAPVEHLDPFKAVEHAEMMEFLARLEWRVRTLAPDVPLPDDFLIDRHFSRKHGSGAYYGQK